MLCCSYSKLFKFSIYRKTAEDKQNSNYIFTSFSKCNTFINFIHYKTNYKITNMYKKYLI